MPSCSNPPSHPRWRSPGAFLADQERPAEAAPVGAVPVAMSNCSAAGPHNLGRPVSAARGPDRTRSPASTGYASDLKDAYGRLLAATEAGSALDKEELALRTDLVFGLIEGVILVHRSRSRPAGRGVRRRDGGRGAADRRTRPPPGLTRPPGLTWPPGPVRAPALTLPPGAPRSPGLRRALSTAGYRAPG